MIHKKFVETMPLYWKMKNKTIFFLFVFTFFVSLCWFVFVASSVICLYTGVQDLLCLIYTTATAVFY